MLLRYDIISIENIFSQATNLQNSYFFKLLCNLNKQQNNDSLYRLTLKRFYYTNNRSCDFVSKRMAYRNVNRTKATLI